MRTDLEIYAELERALSEGYREPTPDQLQRLARLFGRADAPDPVHGESADEYRARLNFGAPEASASTQPKTVRPMLTTLARQVWGEANGELSPLAENQCRFPNWEGRPVVTLSVEDGELRLDTPGCPEQPCMSLEEVTEAFIRWGNTPDGWGKALRFFVGELTRETSGA